MTSPHASHPTRVPLHFISVEAASGMALLGAAALALIWANTPFAPYYEALWHLPLGLGVARFLPAHDLHFWVNDGLMTVFFLVVGLEIRREMHNGALADAKVALLPLIAAAGGVVVPALLYIAVNTDAVTRRGWAIPTATDIAFAVGVLALVGKGIPASLRMLLLTLAIIDDIAAILVIALVYSGGIDWIGFPIIAAGVALVFLLQWWGQGSLFAYVLPGAVIWYGMLRTGMHPTLAGVILGLLTPVRAEFARRARVARRADRTSHPGRGGPASVGRLRHHAAVRPRQCRREPPRLPRRGALAQRGGRSPPGAAGRQALRDRAGLLPRGAHAVCARCRTTSGGATSSCSACSARSASRSRSSWRTWPSKTRRCWPQPR